MAVPLNPNANASAPLSRSEFRRRLRRLEPRRFRQFVADLWSARDWQTDIREDRLYATREHQETTRVFRLHDGRRFDVADARDLDPSVVDGAITRGRASHRARSLAREHGLVVLDADDLYEQSRYAIDRRTFDTLVGEHFEFHGVDAAVIGLGTTIRHATARLSRISPPVVALVIVLASVLVVVASVTSIGPSASSFSPDSTTDPDMPTSGSSVMAISTPTTTPATFRIPACPTPPIGAPPSALAPRLNASGVSSSLAEWRLIDSQALSTFDPASRRIRRLPQERYVASYATQRGTRYRLELDRWRTPDDATEAIERETIPWHGRITWGVYSLRVRGYSVNKTILDESIATEPALRLLAAVWAPREQRPLGTSCVVARLRARPR